ncbi:MAG: AraC family transcriptional regulator [Odoribacter sp.]|nr:AraC family transcriptional regulator [Odoribacter sp.]
MKKYIKVPTSLVAESACQVSLKLDGCSVIDSCVHSMGGSGTMFLEEHLLLFVLEGTNHLTYGKQEYIVGKNEMILLKKATSVKYRKLGNPENDNIYDSIMFCLKDELLKDFLSLANIAIPPMDEEIKTSVNPMTPCLIAFAYSLKPYFNDSSSVNPGLLRLKIMELLYNVAECSKNMFRQILQLRQPVRTDIRQVVEQHYASPVNIAELAYLSGRSLSSFKRDFQLIYNMPPAKWIREKRLEKAKEMFENTVLPVSEICYSLGFENLSHFSRIFKEHYGYSPTAYRE